MISNSLFSKLIKNPRHILLHQLYKMKKLLFGVNKIHHRLDTASILDLHKKMGWFTSRANRKAIDINGKPLPWFCYPAISYLANLNLSGVKVLELGAGSSSFWFANLGADVTSIESDYDFYLKLKSEIPENVCLIFNENVAQIPDIKKYLRGAQIIVIDSIHRIYDAEFVCRELIEIEDRNVQFIIFDNAERYPKLIKSICANLDLLQVDFIGLGPINDYEWSTSILFNRNCQIINTSNFISAANSSSHMNGQISNLDKELETTESARSSYSLNQIDKKMSRIFSEKKNGFFVELGANDGISQSNTLYFENYLGWKGILIEPITEKFNECRINRSPRNTYFNSACVSDSFGDEIMPILYSNLMTVGLRGESDIEDRVSHAKSGEKFLAGKNYLTESNARTLTSILDESEAPSLMDFLSLDVEGSELEVLKGLDHRKYRFEYICVECRDVDRMQAYLAEYGYTLKEKLSFHDYLFENQFQVSGGINSAEST